MENTNDYGFNEKSLLNINRPTKLILKVDYIHSSDRYLDERIYLPFLLDNPKNTIEFCFNTHPTDLSPPLKCNDPLNLWYKNNNDLAQRVSDCMEYLCI